MNKKGCSNDAGPNAPQVMKLWTLLRGAKRMRHRVSSEPPLQRYRQSSSHASKLWLRSQPSCKARLETHFPWAASKAVALTCMRPLPRPAAWAVLIYSQCALSTRFLPRPSPIFQPLTHRPVWGVRSDGFHYGLDFALVSNSIVIEELLRAAPHAICFLWFNGRNPN